MKSIQEFQSMTSDQRAKNLASRAVKQSEAKKEISKILVAAEAAGDFGKGKGEMNAYATKITGVELRREAQGVYEYCNVLREILSGKLAVTEAEFDSARFGSFPLIVLSGLMSKAPEKVTEALEIIRSGIDVTKRLQALIKVEKESDAGGESGPGEGEGSEIQTPEIPGTSYFVPEGMPLLNCPEIVAAIVADIKGAGSLGDIENYLATFLKLSAIAESRGETLEAEAVETPAAVAA